MTTPIRAFPQDTAAAGTPAPADEEALTLRAQGGDLEAFEQLMGLHVRRVRTWLALRAPAEHLIDELAHETFVYAYRHLQEFTAGTALGAWLRAIAGNLLRAEVQRFSRERANRLRLGEQLRLEQAEQWANGGGGDSHHQVELLEGCLRQLPESMQRLIELRYRQDLPTAEIATATGRSEAWVRTTLFRVRQQLKEAIVRRGHAGGDASGVPERSD